MLPPKWILSALFVTQGVAFYGISQRSEVVPVARPLAEVPTAIGDSVLAREIAIDQDQRDILRADDYLSREYAGSGGRRASLFVAYFLSQRAGQTPHSPKNCLPGSGWNWSVADTIPLTSPGAPRPSRSIAT